MDKRQVAIELQSARRDAIEFLAHTQGTGYTLEDVGKITIKLFNLQQTLVGKIVKG